MSWSDFATGLGEVRPSELDAARFGLAIARVTVGTAWRDGAESVEQLGERLWSRVAADESDVVIVRSPSELAGLPALGLTLPQRTIIPAGCIVYWSVKTGVMSAPDHPFRVFVLQDGSSRQVTDEHASGRMADADELLELLAASFEGYTSHYSANPLLDSSRIAEGYREWAESTVRSPLGQVYGMMHGDRLVAVAVTKTLDDNPAMREIELAGIDANARGKGLYRVLLQAVDADASRSGIAELVSSTQTHNIRGQRAWAAAGFAPIQSIDTLHVVRTALLSERRR